MTAETRKAMGRIRRKLTIWQALTLDAAGGDDPVREVMFARVEAEREIEGLLERLEARIKDLELSGDWGPR